MQNAMMSEAWQARIAERKRLKEERKTKPKLTVAQRKERDRNRAHARYASNREKALDYNRARRASMTEEQKERARDRARRASMTEEQKEKERARDRARRASMTEEQKEKERARDRARYAANREKHHEYVRAARAANPAKELWRKARARAKRLGREFDISIQDIEAIWPADNFCPLLRVPMEHKTPFAPSLDRIDNTKGYVKGNIMVVSHMANTAKQHATPEMLYRMATICARATAKPGELPAFSRIELVDEFTLPCVSAPALASRSEPRIPHRESASVSPQACVLSPGRPSQS